MAYLIPLVLAVGATAVGSVSAQQLSWDDGVLGSSLDFTFVADPGKVWVLGVSTIEGPTPMALVDPSDPRMLFLGLDLLSLWTAGFVPPDSVAQTDYGLPSDPTLLGIKLHAQAMTLPGAVMLVDDLSNTVALRLQLPGTAVATVGKLPTPGIGHTQTALANGRVLLVGGADENGALLGIHETFWPQGQVFVEDAASIEPRVDHTATRIAGGLVLVAGGRGGADALAACELYAPTAGSVSPAAPLPAPRSQHTATALADGRVLVVGGLAIDDPQDVVASLLSAHAGTAIYDPPSDTWSAGPSLPHGLVGHAATRLPDGRVLLTGGVELGSLFGFPLQTWTDAAWLFDPMQGTWTPAAPLPQAIARHTAIVPAGDGRALVIGGERIEPFFLPVTVAGVHRYEPSSDSWTTLAPLHSPRAHHAVVEAAGRIVVVGGIAALDSMTLVETPELSAEVASADLSAWTQVPLQAPRNRARATAIDGGLRVLVTGGPSEAAPTPTAEMVMP